MQDDNIKQPKELEQNADPNLSEELSGDMRAKPEFYEEIGPVEEKDTGQTNWREDSIRDTDHG